MAPVTPPAAPAADPAPVLSAEAEEIRDELEPQTAALQLIAALLVGAAAWALGTILVPFVLAVVLAIALTPLANRLERLGAPRVLASLASMLLVAALLLGTLGLVLVQTGRMIGQSDQLIDQTAGSLSQFSERLGGDRILQSLGILQDAPTEPGTGPETDPDAAAADGAEAWSRLLRTSLRATGGWVASGLGGLAGVLAGTVVVLAFQFYLIQTREQLSIRLIRVLGRLGLRRDRLALDRSRHEIVVFVGFVSLVALSYAAIATLVFWAIGLPSPLLWGVLSGLCEFIPFFGPMIAGALISLVALSQGTLWQPLAVLALFVVFNLVEGYVITPIVYGSAVEIDPVTSLLGVLFFGYLWGPLGSVLAMPMLILLRGLVVMAPDTPALDALADVEDRKPTAEHTAFRQAEPTHPTG